VHFDTVCKNIFFKSTDNYCEKNGMRITANRLLYSTAWIVFALQFVYIALLLFKLLFALLKN